MEAPLATRLIEIWQADAQGIQYQGGGDPRGKWGPVFTGLRSCAADPQTGEFRFETIRPGAVLGPGWHAGKNGAGGGGGRMSACGSCRAGINLRPA